MNNLRIENEIDYLLNGAILCNEAPKSNDGIKQFSPYFASIPYRTNAIPELEELTALLEKKFPELLKYGKARAQKAYHSSIGSATKPSYSGRIYGTDGTDLNQFDSIVKIVRKEPYSGGLVFSVCLPQDLINRQRPGYVPCLTSGTFLVNENKLDINASFRSQSIVEFGVFDLLFLRNFQEKMYRTIFEIYESKGKPIEIGNLNIFSARIFVHRRLVKIGNYQFTRREDILPNWINIVQSFAQEKRFMN